MNVFYLMITIYITLCLATYSCTDAQWHKATSLGNAATIKCYSGGTLIVDDKSTGKVLSEESSDGYYYQSKMSGKFKEVSGDCIITYK